jgi:hypothetical protein
LKHFFLCNKDKQRLNCFQKGTVKSFINCTNKADGLIALKNQSFLLLKDTNLYHLNKNGEINQLGIDKVTTMSIAYYREVNFFL